MKDRRTEEGKKKKKKAVEGDWGSVTAALTELLEKVSGLDAA